MTATQLRAVIERLIAAGQRRPDDPDIVIVADTGYDITRLAYVLAGLPVELVGRLRPPARGPAAHPAPATAGPHPATTSGKRQT